MVSKLTSLTQIALDSTRMSKRSDKYEIITPLMNDGFEMNLGKVDYQLVQKSKHDLLNLLTIKSEGLTFKNILVKRKHNMETALWITLGDNCKEYDWVLLEKLLKLQTEMKEYAYVHWRGKVRSQDIKVTKIDF